MKSLRRLVIFAVPIFLIGFLVSELYKWNYIPHEQKLPDSFNIPKFGTMSDADKDRIEDGEDILENAKTYISRRPDYEEKNYINGWSDSNKGKATDLVAFSLREAGYNLQELIRKDYEKNPKAYGEKIDDIQSAFREVKYQKIFMSRYFDEYATDLSKMSDWQAGDIIFFEKNHVGIVADRVNKNGNRFIIHHFWQFQAGYFQDVIELDHWGKITGHYRANKRALSPKTD